MLKEMNHLFSFVSLRLGQKGSQRYILQRHENSMFRGGGLAGEEKSRRNLELVRDGEPARKNVTRSCIKYKNEANPVATETVGHGRRSF